MCPDGVDHSEYYNWTNTGYMYYSHGEFMNRTVAQAVWHGYFASASGDGLFAIGR